MKRKKPNLTNSLEKSDLFWKLGREPFLEVDSLDGKGDEVESKVEGGEMVEGSHQQGLHLVLRLQCFVWERRWIRIGGKPESCCEKETWANERRRRLAVMCCLCVQNSEYVLMPMSMAIVLINLMSMTEPSVAFTWLASSRRGVEYLGWLPSGGRSVCYTPYLNSGLMWVAI